MAFVAATGSSVFMTNAPSSNTAAKYRFMKLKGEYGVASRSEMSEKNGTAEDPDAAAEEAYTNRAYPGDDIPFSATLNAQQGFAKLKSLKSKNTVGAWNLVGPSNAIFPDILTFSGQQYTTSGRITALAIAPNCSGNGCRLWVAAAGGGVWRTDNALGGGSWTFLSGSFGTNAIGTLTYDAANNALYAGTGEPNASGDSEAGLGIWKSTNGGDTWTQLSSTVSGLTTPGNGTYTGNAFAGRSISSIVVDPTNANHLYVSSTRGVRGVSSSTGGATTNPPTPRPPFGLFESTDGGATFSFIWDGNGTIRGVNHAELDPNNPSIVYAAAFNQGIWRKVGAAAFTQIKTPLNAAIDPDRAEFATTALPGGFTRMYVGIGGPSDQPPTRARVYRTDAAAGAAAFTDLTNSQNIGYCGQGGGPTSGAQCWYDNFVVTPAGHPDTVYIGGAYSYFTYGFSTNGRGVLYSTDAGVNWTDETWDATTNKTPKGSCCQPNPISPNGIHPDQHALVVNPNNPTQFFDGSDGGLMRSTGDFKDISSQCTARGLSGADLTLCQQLLSRVPGHLYSMNNGLSTLQFQSLSVAANDPKHLQGGTQDNGTFETTGAAGTWPQIIYGDGGQSGFSATNSALRLNTFTGQANDVNFQNGDPSKWVIATGPILSSVEAAAFYPPLLADPHSGAAGTIFQGSRHVWRTQDWAGSQAYLEANCPEFTTNAATFACGDFQPLGGPSALDCQPPGAACLNTGGDLGGTVYGTDRRPTAASRVGSAIARTPANTGTAWAATAGGRVFISDNIDNATPSSVVWNRVDADLATSADPTRFPSSISIDPANAHHAWVSYSGYNFNTASQPGHVFSVSWSGSGAATWTDISYNLADFPVSSVVRDDVNGDLYASSDFGVVRLPFGTTTWVVAGTGLPQVEVPGLTIVSSARKLYAATHGRSAWQLTLP